MNITTYQHVENVAFQYDSQFPDLGVLSFVTQLNALLCNIKDRKAERIKD